MAGRGYFRVELCRLNLSANCLCPAAEAAALTGHFHRERLYPAVRDKGQQDLLAYLGSQLPLTSEQP